MFIGPPPEAIEAMGDKVAARRLADAAGVPIVPGTREPVDIDDAKSRPPRIGYPMLLKAAFGGGGKGMHVVRGAERTRGIRSSGRAREAQAYFGRASVFLERYVDRAHHSRRRSSRTPTATSCSSASATARCNADTRS